MTSSGERKAKNEAAFRAVNEELEPLARETVRGNEEARVPFLCECSDPRCTRVIGLTLAEYEHVRSVASWGFVLPGHEDPTVERVVERGERFDVTEKLGEAAETVEDIGLQP